MLRNLLALNHLLQFKSESYVTAPAKHKKKTIQEVIKYATCWIFLYFSYPRIRKYKTNDSTFDKAFKQINHLYVFDKGQFYCFGNSIDM